MQNKITAHPDTPKKLRIEVHQVIEIPCDNLDEVQEKLLDYCNKLAGAGLGPVGQALFDKKHACLHQKTDEQVTISSYMAAVIDVSSVVLAKDMPH